MKNYLQKLLIFFSLNKIDTDSINIWYKKKNVELLKFSLREGLYLQRVEAIEALKKLKRVEIIPELLTIVRKDFEPVSNAALAAIEKLDTNRNFIEEVKELKAFLKLRKKPSRIENDTAVILDRTKMQNLEHIRKMLRSPMGGGKWF